MATKYSNGLGVSVSLEDVSGEVKQSTKGNKALAGVLKRGPEGEWIPVADINGYNNIFGDPNDATWCLYANGESMAPDATRAFFNETGDRGSLWPLRVAVPGAKKASVQLSSRVGASVLSIEAANNGRWAGYSRSVSNLPVVLATANTFTLDSAGVEANDYAGATVTFDNGKSYKVVSNGKSAANGLTVYRISSDNNLPSDGITGPVVLDGTASYEATATISGTIAYAPTAAITGTVTVAALQPLELTGVGTTFLTEFAVGDSVFFGGEERVVTSIASDLSMFIDAGFSSTLTAATISKANLTVTGTLTKFTGETVLSKVVSVGTPLSVTISGTTYTRTVASITSATELELSSGFPVTVPALTTVTIPNYYVEGVASAYDTQLVVGDLLVDPSGSGLPTVAVAQVVDAETVKLAAPFNASFNDLVLTKIAATGSVSLTHTTDTGLSVVIAPGDKNPTTHFSFEVLFNGNSVGLRFPDATLDPSSPLFIESLAVKTSANVITDGKGSRSWPCYFTAASLFGGEYETSSVKDVRPWNGSGAIVGLSETRLYTVADFDYAAAVQNWVYPSIYGDLPKFRLKATAGVAPVVIAGTINLVASSVAVVGVGTNFLTVFGSSYDATANPAYLYDQTSGLARKILSVTDDTHLTLAEAFPVSVAGSGRVAKKAGYLSVAQGQSFLDHAEVGDTFVVSYPTPLTGGADGDITALTAYNYSRYFRTDGTVVDIKSAATGRNQGFIAIGIPGVTDEAVNADVRDYAEKVAYFYQYEIPANITTGLEAEAYAAGSFGKSNCCGAVFPSYAYRADEFTGNERLYPITGNLFGKESVVAIAADGYHVLASGTQGGNGILKGITRLPVALKPGEVTDLRAAGIRPLILEAGRPTLWGETIAALDDRYAQITSAYMALDYINMFQEQPAIKDLLFRVNQPDIGSELVLIFTRFGRSEYDKGVYSKFISRDASFSAEIIEPQPQGTGQMDQIFALDKLLSGVPGIRFTCVPAGVVRGIDIVIGVKGVADVASSVGVL